MPSFFVPMVTEHLSSLVFHWQFAGLAPGPFAGLILSDWGADVVRVDRPGAFSADVLCRNKRSIAVARGIRRSRRRN